MQNVEVQAAHLRFAACLGCASISYWNELGNLDSRHRPFWGETPKASHQRHE
jgi:hypothetical protein